MTMALRRKSQPLRRLAALLGVVAVLVRCVIAPGFMPDLAAAAHGTFKLVICTGGGEKTLPGTSDDGSQRPHHHGDDGQCPYAAAGHVAAPPAFAGLAIADFEPAFGTPLYQRVLLAPRVDGLRARAPPHIL